MILETHEPSAILKPYIKAYRIIESQDELVNRVIPNTSCAMAFRFKGEISYLNDTEKTSLPLGTFSGLRKSVRLINYAPRTRALIVLFKETGVSAFIKQPLHELFEESISLDNFFPSSEILKIEQRLAETEENKSKIAIIEAFLCSKLLSSRPDALVSEAINKIYANNGLIKIRSLTDALYLSQDAFEKRFRKVTGTSPKQFSSIVRLKTIIHRNTSPASLTEIALANGYYDQSHFNKDFKLFTGLTPKTFFESASFW